MSRRVLLVAALIAVLAGSVTVGAQYGWFTQNGGLIARMSSAIAAVTIQQDGSGPWMEWVSGSTRYRWNKSGTSLLLQASTDGGGTWTTVSTTTSGVALSGESFSGLQVSPTFVEAASGNHPLLAGVALNAPAVTAGAATVSDTATLYIAGAANATVSGGNYALWVAGGASRFDGEITSSSSITASTVMRAQFAQIDAAQAYYWTNRSAIQSPADGQILLTNNGLADFSRLQFGGTTSAFPALRRNGTSLQSRLADDTGWAPFDLGAYQAAPAAPSNGQAWVECTGVSPSRVCAIKVQDGGATRTIASMTY